MQWRISSTDFSHPAHPEEDWGLLRKQLPTASVERSDGGTPPMVLLVDEIAGMARFHRETEHLPFGGYPGTEHYLSLTADIESSLEQLGPRLRGIAAGALSGAYNPAWTSPARGSKPPWEDLFAAGEQLFDELKQPDSLVAALDDALECTTQERLEDALIGLTPLLDELRAVAELQRGPWRRTQQLMERHLTVLEAREDGTSPGVHAQGTKADVILAGLHEALRATPEQREYAIWIGTLAGPSATEEPRTAAVAGPIAVSGIPCTGDIEAWTVAVRSELSAAFIASGRTVPDDVLAFGEPSYFHGAVLDDGKDLWSQMADPHSFVVRVAVRATTAEEAIVEAREALRAVYDFDGAGLGQDLRPDVIVWTETGGWSKPSSSARGRSVGELMAARYASRAVVSWAEDLGSPMDQQKLDLLRSRALVGNPLATPEVRLMRAFASLETLTPADSKFDHVAGRLWLRSLRHEGRSLLMHLTTKIQTPVTLGPPRDGAVWEDRDAKRSAFAESSPRWGLEVLDAVDDVLEVIHPHAMVPVLSRATREHLTEPANVTRARARHTAAVRRARRHRNLATHGHRLSDRALLPTVAFLGRQLELAVAGHHADTAGDNSLGSLTTEPDGASAEPTIAEVISR